MKSKKIPILVLVIVLILLVTSIDPNKVWASGSQVESLDQSFAAAASGSLFGSRLTITNDASLDEQEPAVAYNSQRQEYLVVWFNDRAGNDDIRAQRVTKNGTLIGGPFYISAGSGADRRYPDVTYNVQTNQYLVVWQHYDPVNEYAIHGRRVTETGQIVDSTDIVIRDGGFGISFPGRPTVAYAFTSNKYLVVWEDELNPTPTNDWVDIVGQAVNSDGSLSGINFRVSADPGGNPRHKPALAYNRRLNGFLVVWTQVTTPYFMIYGQLVNGSGVIPSYNPIVVATGVGNNSTPAVAAIPTATATGQFLVAWDQVGPLNHGRIFGTLVSGDGTNIGGLLWICDETGVGLTSPPGAAGDEFSQRYFVTWRNPLGVTSSPIHGQALSTTGAPLGQEAEFQGTAANMPVVTAGKNGDFMVVWQDMTLWATQKDIYGQLWGNRVYLPLVRR
jgi:hypothetical protein